MRFLFFLLAFFVGSTHGVSQKPSYPRIVNAPCSDVDEEVLELAKEAFYSNVWHWHDLQNYDFNPKAPYRIFLRRSWGKDPKKGYFEFYKHDPSLIHFETLKVRDDYMPYTRKGRHYWLKEPHLGGTFVVSIVPFNWKGAHSSLLWIPDFDANAYRKKVERTDQQQVPIKIDITDAMKSERVWQPLFLIQVKRNDKIIALDPGLWRLGTWHVFVPMGDGKVRKCAVEFSPKELYGGKYFEGKNLKRLWVLLDDIIGIPSGWQGTLDPIGTVRHEVQVALTNAGVRPWAILNAGVLPYNTREQVEEGLLKWRKGHPTYKKQYQELQKLYPKAEADLALYYQEKFGYEAPKARADAKVILDYLYRSHFVFSKGA